jgi:hypothetical protein
MTRATGTEISAVMARKEAMLEPNQSYLAI